MYCKSSGLIIIYTCYYSFCYIYMHTVTYNYLLIISTQYMHVHCIALDLYIHLLGILNISIPSTGVNTKCIDLHSK